MRPLFLSEEFQMADNQVKGSTCVVGCKLPAGLVIRGAGKQWRVKGCNDSMIIGGFGLTYDVPSEIWNDFAKNHAKSKMIRNGVVFAVNDGRSANSAAKEREKQRTGMERLDPNKQNTKPDTEE